MSSPSKTLFYKNGELVGSVFCNFGWISPSHYDVATYLISLGSGEETSRYSTHIEMPISPDWDVMFQRHIGRITREDFLKLKKTVLDIQNGEELKSRLHLCDYFEDNE